MMERSNVFSTHEIDVGCIKSTQHTIKTNDDKPIRERSCRLPPAYLEALRQHLSELKGAGIITESRSVRQMRGCFRGRLTDAPVLAFANPQLPYVLHVDAS